MKPDLAPKKLLPVFRKTPNISEEQEELLQALHKVQQELEIANQNFEYATDPQLIDSCIYELKALQLKYEYYLKQAKENDLLEELF
ncbi:MAG: YaaL family protein [Epulopiscium sp.]|nr:YaaL family protein [Candidatus Epulonipiscium sp.]